MFSSLMKNTNLFTILTKFLIITLPFYVIIKIYFDKELWLSFFGFFIKELIIILLFLILIYEYFFNKKNIEIELKFNILDYLIFAFIAYWIIITLLNWLWLPSLFYGGRYDFLWFVVFLIFKHWKVFLKESTKNLIKLFLLWGGISLFLGIVVKFILWEEILSLFWFTIQVSEFWFWWWIPIYQWVEASWIRRFQWILDSPLAMWYFLLLFTWLFASINKKYIDFSVVLWLSILFVLIFLTYSRAAMLWILIGGWILFILNFKYILKHFKKVLIFSLIWIILWVWTLLYVFQDKIHNVFFRDGSTSWHITRMITWVERFIEKPLGSGLSTSGPAYRSVFPDKVSLEGDRYHIPESWFVQILVEWGFIYFWLFVFILLNILFDLYKNNNKYILVMFIWILVMNLFLHIFEATYITILLFLFLALFYTGQNLQKAK
jgi:hypothetical protein